MFCHTIGQKEVHSADGRNYIEHTGERSWTVVWEGRKVEPPFSTRKHARIHIRARKTSPQLTLF
jgi:hypothetical protein